MKERRKAIPLFDQPVLFSKLPKATDAGTFSADEAANAIMVATFRSDGEGES